MGNSHHSLNSDIKSCVSFVLKRAPSKCDWTNDERSRLRDEFVAEFLEQNKSIKVKTINPFCPIIMEGS